MELRTMTCPDCAGEGQIYRYVSDQYESCERCATQGRVTAPEALLAVLVEHFTKKTSVQASCTVYGHGDCVGPTCVICDQRQDDGDG